MPDATRSLLISRHDYRTRRKANFHFIADELARIGPTRFFSSSFSLLSLLTRDARRPLWERANRVETVGGVECYLWRTVAHPSKAPELLRRPVDAWFRWYAAHPPAQLRDWIRTSDVVLLESGGPEIFFDLIRATNPACRIVYVASDTLDVIGAAAQVVVALRRAARLFDAIILPSPRLAAAFPPGCKLHFVPHGMDPGALRTDAPSPYTTGGNLVSVGNMLFDPEFFRIAAEACPDVHFQVIGGGAAAAGLALPNISVLPETPFAETLAYINHADAGVAPYGGDAIPPYLTDTSMKLMQYKYFGLPAICPVVVAGDDPRRFGYVPGDRASIAAAVRGALAAGRVAGSSFLTWAEVTRRILDPDEFPDTRV